MKEKTELHDSREGKGIHPAFSQNTVNEYNASTSIPLTGKHEGTEDFAIMDRGEVAAEILLLDQHDKRRPVVVLSKYPQYPASAHVREEDNTLVVSHPRGTKVVLD